MKGVSLFLLPRTLDDGSANAYRIVRLKDKLGTRSMASVVDFPGGHRGIASPIKLSRAPATYRLPPLAEGERFLPRTAAHND